MTDCDRTWKEMAVVFDLLEGEEKRRFETHLADCATCRTTVERLKKLEARVRELKGSLHGTHPAPEEIYDYAAGPGAESIEDPERASALERHFRRCSGCFREVERIRALDQTASPIREILRGEPPTPDPSPAPVPSIAQLMQTVDHRISDDGAEGQVLRSPFWPIRPRRRRALVPALAAAASIALALVFLHGARTSRVTTWVVVSPGTQARQLAPEGPILLRAGEALPAKTRIENPGPGPLVLVESTTEREPRVCILEPGSTLDLPQNPLSSLAIPNGRGLVAGATGSRLPTLRLIGRSGLIAPRLTIRERRPSFAFAPRGEGRRYRIVCLRRNLTTGETTILFTTPEGEGPVIPYPADAAALDYDVDHAFEWRLDMAGEDGTVESVGPVDFYLDPDPEPKRAEAEALRGLVPSSKATGHFLAANHYLRAELYVDAMRELLASDPSLADEGVRGLFEKLARSLEVDVQAAQALLGPPAR